LTRVFPNELYGDQAVKAYLAFQARQEKAPKKHLAEPPFTKRTFNLEDPEHRQYVEEFFQEVERVSHDLFGNSEKGLDMLLCEAVEQGRLPLAALDLRPDWKEMVKSRMRTPASNRKRGKTTGRPLMVI
jgi:hypothetical protein